MWGVLSKVLLVVIIILAIPTTLILASQNANPGDATYPVKRGIEGVLSSALSLTPVTRAYFKTDLSNRRYKESIVLLKKSSSDKSVTNTALIEMLNTTAQARSEINKVSDPVVKKQLSDDLSKQITVYKQGLLQVEQQKKQTTVEVVISPTIIPTTSITQRLNPTPTQTQTRECTESIRNYTRCGATVGFENYSKNHLLGIAEYTNSCTNKKRTAITEDWDLVSIECDSNIIGDCSADNIPACIDMFEKPVFTSSVSNSNGSVTITVTPTKGPIVTVATTPTPQNIIYRTMQFIFPRNTNTSGQPPPGLNDGFGSLASGGPMGSFESPILESSESATAKISFKANATDEEPNLTKGEIYIVKATATEMSETECSGDNGSKVVGNLAWCKILTATLSGNSGNISGSWKVLVPGEYYAVINIYSGVMVCSGNPWCKFSGKSCIADESGSACVDCKGVSDCGESSKIKFTIQ
ncbi:MAG: hypothetical protein WCV81_04535 [Microgenomates group bacterium]|jgi:hypothetical protein